MPLFCAAAGSRTRMAVSSSTASLRPCGRGVQRTQLSCALMPLVDAYLLYLLAMYQHPSHMQSSPPPRGNPQLRPGAAVWAATCIAGRPRHIQAANEPYSHGADPGADALDGGHRAGHYSFLSLLPHSRYAANAVCCYSDRQGCCVLYITHRCIAYSAHGHGWNWWQTKHGRFL